MSEAKQSDSNDLLGPLPEAAHHSNGPFGLSVVPLYTAEQMRAFRAEGVAAERERCEKHLRDLAAGHQRAADMADNSDVAQRHDAMSAALLAAIEGPNATAMRHAAGEKR